MQKKRKLRFAAIDIGSNAVRVMISRVRRDNNYPNFKRLEYVRYPLRLGIEVFSEGRIPAHKEEKFMTFMQIVRSLMELYEVDDYMICATSALRESENGRELAARVLETFGLRLDIISGSREAELINKAIKIFVDKPNYIHIDVGGGSTEINIYHHKIKCGSRSFRLGSVRNLESDKATSYDWKPMKEWVLEQIGDFAGEIHAIGTGGNINKLYDLSQKLTSNILPLSELLELQEKLSVLSYEERMMQFGLNEDRADVIVPASAIYRRAVEAAEADEIIVPKVGLREGILSALYEKNLFMLEDTGTSNFKVT